MKVDIKQNENTLNARLTQISKDLPAKTKRMVSQSLTEGVKIAEQETPRSGMSFAERQQRAGEKKRQYHLKPAADSIKRDTTQSLGVLDYAGQIRYDSKAYWVIMSNYGSVHQRPQHYIRRSREKITDNDTQLKLKLVKEVFGQ